MTAQEEIQAKIDELDKQSKKLYAGKISFTKDELIALALKGNTIEGQIKGLQTALEILNKKP